MLEVRCVWRIQRLGKSDILEEGLKTIQNFHMRHIMKNKWVKI